MNHLNSGFITRLHVSSILKATVIILAAFWSWPVTARPPSLADKDDVTARKRDANRDNSSVSRPAFQNNQPARISHREAVSRPTASASRSFASPQPPIIRSPIAGDGITTTHTRRIAPPSPVSQPAPRPSIERAAVKLPDFKPRVVPVASDESTTKRKINVPKFEIAADNTKATNPSSANANQRAGRQEMLQRLQDRGQSNKIIDTDKTNQNTRVGGATGGKSAISTPGGNENTSLPSGFGVRAGSSKVRQQLQDSGQSNKIIDTDKTNQNTRVGGATGGQSITSAPGGTGASATDKNTNLQQNLRSGSGPSMSEIRKRLNDQGRAKGILPGVSDDKAQTTSSKINANTDATTTIKSGNPADATSIDRIRQRLGADNKSGIRGPLDLKLNDKKETPSLKLKGDDIGPAIITKKLQGIEGGPNFMTKQPHSPPQIGDMKAARDNMLKSRFPDRLKSGELEKVTKGDIAQKVKLSDQFHLMQQGDVARRLDLQKHITNFGGGKNVHINNVHQLYNVNKLTKAADFYAVRPHYYHGAISPAYINHCFKFAYFGPTFFAGACWYPHWNPWVAWSWQYRCLPIWDPRPIWCRPVIYDPYYNWVYWQTPIWVTLPVVDCGTWVDVQRPLVPEAQYDLQLLAVRFVDPGHPEEKLGPRYRVWFRNNSNQPIERPFSVMLFAGNDDKLTADLPRGGVRVSAIEAGDTQSADIRLPLEVATLWRDADGNPAPFQVLHALIDANREIQDVTLTNNGARVPRDEVLPVDPAAFEVDPSSSTPGGELILAGEGLGPQPGQVLVNVAGQELQAEVLGWYDLGVRINVPQVQLSEPTPAEVIVVRGDGAATNPVKITLSPGQPGPTLVPPPPAPALESP